MEIQDRSNLKFNPDLLINRSDQGYLEHSTVATASPGPVNRPSSDNPTGCAAQPVRDDFFLRGEVGVIGS